MVRTATGSRVCQCQEARSTAARVKRARIPAGYETATLDNLKPLPHNRAALGMARRFVEEFTPGGKIAGLMLTGNPGTGKTHLAVGVLRKLAEDKGVDGRFVDVRELLDRLRSSYDSDAKESQAGILKPIFAADLVVIDELGAARPTDWSFETIELLIGGLYNSNTPVVVTTNYLNQAVAQGGNEYARAARQETLAERIGGRMWSRLQQMTVAVDMTGPDWREGKR